MPDDVNDLKTQIAVVINKIENLSHDVKNVAAVLPSFITRREFDDRFDFLRRDLDERSAHRKETHEALKDRTSRLESHVVWAVRAVTGAVISIILAAVFYFKRGV